MGAKALAGLAFAGGGLIAVTSDAPPPALHATSAAVHLASSDGNLFTDFANGLSSPDAFANFLAVFGPDLSGFLNNTLDNLTAGLNLGGLTSNLSSELTTGLAGITGASSTAGVQNIPYNVLADIINVPYSYSLGYKEYAYAVGPADTTGGVPGWIPPGATVANGGVDPVTDQYTLGGTGSYYFESVGNTWGWDDGNWAQVDGLASLLVPFPALTQPVAYDLQYLAQAEIVDGATVNCEFECADWAGYLGRWLHTPLGQVLSPGYTFPTVIQNVASANTAVNTTGVPGNTPAGLAVIWSGQTPGPLENPFASVYNNLTASPASDPIHIPNPVTYEHNIIDLLYGDVNSTFDPFITGSFVYWGAPTLYTIPALLGGFFQDLTGIPNQFDFANSGAEPAFGPTAGPSSLLPGLAEGFQYLLTGNGPDPTVPGDHGLLGYLNPSTYAEAFSHNASMLSSGLSGLLDSTGSASQLAPDLTTLPTMLLP
jgi:hypothetical protein